MTSKLDEIVAVPSRQMSLDELMAVIQEEEREAAAKNGNRGWLVWFDNDPERLVDEKIKMACARFEAKHRRKPVEVRVHSRLSGGDVAVGKIKVKVVPDPLVAVHCFWVGMVPSREE